MGGWRVVWGCIQQQFTIVRQMSFYQSQLIAGSGKQKTECGNSFFNHFDQASLYFVSRGLGDWGDGNMTPVSQPDKARRSWLPASKTVNTKYNSFLF